MIAVDTSAWVECMIGSSLGLTLVATLPAPSDCIVPTMVQLELAKWLLREHRVPQMKLMLSYTGRCVVVPLDTDIARRAAQLSRRYRLATADAVIYATARRHGASLISCDSDFEHLPFVNFFRKK